MKQLSSWRGSSALVLALGFLPSVAQQWKAELPAVEKAGVYRIVLSPEMVGRSQEDLGDMRLLDSLGKEVPCVIEVATAEESKNAFHDFRITRNEVVGKQTFIELDRPTSTFIVDDIHLRIRNAEVQKEVTLTGSDDGAQWFFIKQDLLLLAASDEASTSGLRMIQLPPSDYAYYRLAINDSASAPIQVQAAQWFSYGRSYGKYAEDRSVEWWANTGAKETRLSVRSGYPMMVDRLEYEVSGAERYHRSGRVVHWVSRTSGHGSKRRSWREEESLRAFVLDSDQMPEVDLSGIRADTFDIVIDNGDDRPLQFSDLRFMQLQRTLTADLQPGVQYRLTTGDPKKSSPHYDLIHFKHKLPEPTATIEHGALRALPTAAGTGPAIGLSRWWIWAGLVAVLCIVGFMAVRMLSDHNNKTDST